MVDAVLDLVFDGGRELGGFVPEVDGGCVEEAGFDCCRGAEGEGVNAVYYVVYEGLWRGY